MCIRDRLCCWDDATQGGHGCQRVNCGYNHASILLTAGVAEATDDELHALFKVLPCNMAGMAGGCQIHRDLNFAGWQIPSFKVSVGHSQPSDDRRHPVVCPSKEEELVPLYMSGKWVLQNKVFKEHVHDSVQRYLNGEEMDDLEEWDETQVESKLLPTSRL